ncbi:hypothetical protein BDP55DRAFT_634558 [Colletotrichum godetiae]|uniref:Heterokaryon incompatibility domain-containing protein n=1 Tax=Colletotrichum godetiae TaxID=1209918 RepID=A0AAJ0AGF3_9PEZI|nr:uncharacterized protein BDP55DRAFT_634558 [Colletotrichum godetiae]KAK1672800.1 hypothetical protein BDP55DRAFT_634558 [Colletotrichum godetiae]
MKGKEIQNDDYDYEESLSGARLQFCNNVEPRYAPSSSPNSNEPCPGYYECVICAYCPEFPHDRKTRHFRLYKPRDKFPDVFENGIPSANNICAHYLAISCCWPPQHKHENGNVIEIPRTYKVRDLDGFIRANKALDDILDRAVDVANSFGLRMIWIDQECLPQHPQDVESPYKEYKQLGIQAMHIIYNRAFVTGGLLDVAMSNWQQLEKIRGLISRTRARNSGINRLITNEQGLEIVQEYLCVFLPTVWNSARLARTRAGEYYQTWFIDRIMMHGNLFVGSYVPEAHDDKPTGKRTTASCPDANQEHQYDGLEDDELLKRAKHFGINGVKCCIMHRQFHGAMVTYVFAAEEIHHYCELKTEAEKNSRAGGPHLQLTPGTMVSFLETICTLQNSEGEARRAKELFSIFDIDGPCSAPDEGEDSSVTMIARMTNGSSSSTRSRIKEPVTMRVLGKVRGFWPVMYTHPIGNNLEMPALLYMLALHNGISCVSHRGPAVACPTKTARKWTTIASQKAQKHTTPGIRWSSPTQLLIRPSLAYLWESGRDPEFSNGYGQFRYEEKYSMRVSLAKRITLQTDINNVGRQLQKVVRPDSLTVGNRTGGLLIINTMVIINQPTCDQPSGLNAKLRLPHTPTLRPHSAKLRYLSQTVSSSIRTIPRE